MRLASALLITVLPTLTAAASAQTTPARSSLSNLPVATMSHAEEVEMFTAAQFPISRDGKTALNRCNQVAHPGVLLIDLNGDGRKEAFFVDASPCYGTEGRHFAIATKGADGKWRGMIRQDGSAKAVPSRHDGWVDLSVTLEGKTLLYRHVNEGYGDSYSPFTAQDSAAAAKPAAAATSTAPAAKAYPTDGWPSPMTPAKLNPVQLSQIMTAAGYAKVKGKWTGCDGDSEAAISDETIDGGHAMDDLNHDGHPEVIVTDGGYQCYGNTGQAFVILTPVPGGWKLLFRSIGIAGIQKTMHNGWPDIVIEGPGFCFPSVRWNGKDYVDGGFSYEGKPCKPGG